MFDTMLDIKYMVVMGKEHTTPVASVELAKEQLKSALATWEMLGGSKPYLTNVIG